MCRQVELGTPAPAALVGPPVDRDLRGGVVPRGGATQRAVPAARGPAVAASIGQFCACEKDGQWQPLERTACWREEGGKGGQRQAILARCEKLEAKLETEVGIQSGPMPRNTLPLSRVPWVSWVSMGSRWEA